MFDMNDIIFSDCGRISEGMCAVESEVAKLTLHFPRLRCIDSVVTGSALDRIFTLLITNNSWPILRLDGYRKKALFSGE